MRHPAPALPTLLRLPVHQPCVLTLKCRGKGPRGRHLRKHCLPSGLWPQRGVDSLRTDGLRLNIGVTQSSGLSSSPQIAHATSPDAINQQRTRREGRISPALIPDTHRLPPAMQFKREHPSPQLSCCSSPAGPGLNPVTLFSASVMAASAGSEVV